MTGVKRFEKINEAKANMDHIYNQPYPADYFSELKVLDYDIPDNAKPIFQKLINHLQEQREDSVRVLDLGCSYGVNAALLKHDISMDTLYDLWGDEKPETNALEKAIGEDRQFFADLDEEPIDVIGLDLAEKAVSFAEDVGLLDEGLVIDLENNSLQKQEKEELASVDLVTSTGCVGYITEKSFERLMPTVSQGQSAWIANFVLRLFPFEQIQASLEKWGYVTEKLEGHVFAQRKFASNEEQEQMIEKLNALGVDTSGKEDKGKLFSEFYLSRPVEDAEKYPLESFALA